MTIDIRYALVLAMLDDEKAHVISTRQEDDREWITVITVAGDVFEIMRRDISQEMAGGAAVTRRGPQANREGRAGLRMGGGRQNSPPFL